MEWLYTVMVTALLIMAAVAGGCTGSPQQPVPTPEPVVAATTVPSVPATAATAVPFTTTYMWTTETPYQGHPYSKTYSFHGTGDYEEFTFSTDRDATWVFTLTYPKEGIFTVVLKDARGRELGVLANKGGGGNSQKTIWLEAGDYYFDILADAPWYIMMKTG